MPEERHEALGLRLRTRGHEDAQTVLAPVDDAPHERRQRRAFPLRGASALHGAREIVVVAGRQIQRVARDLEGAEPTLGLAGDGGIRWSGTVTRAAISAAMVASST